MAQVMGHWNSLKIADDRRRSENMFLDAYYHSLYDQKGLGVYLRVAGNDQQKLILVDLDITLTVPYGPIVTKILSMGNTVDRNQNSEHG